MYQLIFKSPKGRFPLPVFGNARTIWDALAKHCHFVSFKTFCKVQGIDPVKHKARFELVKVSA